MAIQWLEAPVLEKLFGTLLWSAVSMVRMILVVVVLSGCQSLSRAIGDLFDAPSLSEEQCRGGRWGEIGFSDGRAGLPAQAQLYEHTQACGRYQIAPVTATYLEGWNIGVRDYCTPQRGHSEGLEGNDYQNVCPADLESAFLVSYRLGQQIYTVRAKYRSMEHELNRNIDEIAKVTDKLANEKDDLRRKRLRDDLVELHKKQQRLSRQISVYQLKHADVLAD